MAFVQLSGISLAFGGRQLLKDVNLNLMSGTRAALTGANGSGKTTLMRILVGEQPPDSGSRIVQKETRVSYLPQSGIIHGGSSLEEEAERAFDEIRRHLDTIDLIGKKLAAATEESEETLRLLDALHRHQELVENSGYYSRRERIDAVLQGLGFSTADKLRPSEEFSGGWQMRIALAKILLEAPDILLLDEPTNYLDIEARVWLEDYLKTFPGGALIVSHDRYFLDVTVSEVIEIFSGRVTRYTGNFTAYEKRREAELAALKESYRNQQEEIARQEEFIRRFRYNASKAAMVQSRIKQLEKIIPIEIPESMKKMHFSFPKPPHSGSRVLSVQGLSKYYSSVPVPRDLSCDLNRGDKLVVTGRNGAGKSTLLRILAGVDTEFSGRIDYGTGVRVGYFAQDRDETPGNARSVMEEIEEVCPTALFPKIRNLLGAFLFRGDDVYKPARVLSGGERNRLSLLKMLLRPANLLILDEPTNHLDMSSKDVLLDALREFSGTLVFVSHDRYFIEGLADKVLELREGLPPRLFPGGYDYYLFRISQEGGLPPEGPAAPSAKVPPSSSRLSREDAKRRKSALGRLERREEAILARIEELEEENRTLQRELSLPEVYEDGSRVKAVMEKIAHNERERENCHRDWEKLAAELDAARS